MMPPPNMGPVLITATIVMAPIAALMIGYDVMEVAEAAPKETTMAAGCVNDARHMIGDKAISYLADCQALRDTLACEEHQIGEEGRSPIARECRRAVDKRRMDGYYLDMARTELK